MACEAVHDVIGLHRVVIGYLRTPASSEWARAQGCEQIGRTGLFRLAVSAHRLIQNRGIA
jgi:hypothetical protein